MVGFIRMVGFMRTPLAVQSAPPLVYLHPGGIKNSHKKFLEEKEHWFWKASYVRSKCTAGRLQIHFGSTPSYLAKDQGRRPEAAIIHK